MLGLTTFIDSPNLKVETGNSRHTGTRIVTQKDSLLNNKFTIRETLGPFQNTVTFRQRSECLKHVFMGCSHSILYTSHLLF